MRYLSVKDMAEKWGISCRRLQVLCREGRIEGAYQLGRVWAIPSDAQKPEDHRLRTGKYIRWREKHGQRQARVSATAR